MLDLKEAIYPQPPRRSTCNKPHSNPRVEECKASGNLIRSLKRSFIWSRALWKKFYKELYKKLCKKLYKKLIRSFYKKLYKKLEAL